MIDTDQVTQVLEGPNANGFLIELIFRLQLNVRVAYRSGEPFDRATIKAFTELTMRCVAQLRAGHGRGEGYPPGALVTALMEIAESSACGPDLAHDVERALEALRHK